MNYMNSIFETELPTVSLYHPYPNKKEHYRDADKFAKDLAENAMKIS